MSETVWINGSLVAPDAASVSAFDHGLTVGDGVFETLRVYRGTPFALTRHLERLRRSAEGLRLPCPDDEVVREAVKAVVEASGLQEARLRITVTGGPAPMGSGRAAVDPTLIATVSNLEPWPESASVVTVPWPRNEHGALAGIKTTSYGENVIALAYAHERDASEAIFGNLAGSLCEGTGSNVFVVLGGRLVTPTLMSGCLAGVTRQLLIESVEIDVEERDGRLSSLGDAEEAFLTSSTREVQPISTVDGNALRECPGPRTREAADAFRALVERDLDP